MANVNLKSTKAEIFQALRIARNDLSAWQARQRCLDLSGDRIRELIEARKEIHRLGVELTHAETKVAAANRREGQAMAKVSQMMYRPSFFRRLVSRLTHW